MGEGYFGRVPTGAALLLLLQLGGCGGSFDIAPSEVPKMKGGATEPTVTTTDGEAQEVPSEWTADIVARDPPGKMVVREAKHEDASSCGVSAPSDRSTPSVFFSSFDEFGITAPSEKRSAGAAPAEPAGGPTLWVRHPGTSTISIPLGAIDHVTVHFGSTGGGGDPTMILLGVLGGTAVAAITAGLSAGLNNIHYPEK
jgi:hypothetical protein